MKTEHLQILFGVIALGIITFIYRYSFVSHHGKKLAEKIPPQFLMLLAPATFAAIITNSLIAHPKSPLELQQKIIAFAIALPVAYLTRNVILTLLVGLGVLYFIQNSNLF